MTRLILRAIGDIFYVLMWNVMPEAICLLMWLAS
jgi:hypothetical protein